MNYDDPAIQADGFRVDIEQESKEIRLVLFKKNSDHPVAVLLMPSENGYQMAARILQGYDELEGIG